MTSADSIGLWGSGSKETKLDIIQEIGDISGVRSLLISNLKISTLRKVRKLVKKGFDQKLTPGKDKTQCLKELHKVFPSIDRATPLIGMLNLIEVVNNCQTLKK